MKNYAFTSIFLCLVSTNLMAQSSSCLEMTNMAQDIANIRDMGVPLSAVEARLKRDVPDERERALGIVTANIVYAGRHKGDSLKREILKKCKK